MIKHRLNIKRILRLLLLSGLLIIFACSKEEPTEPEDNDNKVVLEEIDDVLPNPFKGFAPWIGVNNPVYDTKLQQATFTWKELEPQQGQYNWARLEQNWGNVAANGKRVGFRITAALPGDPGHFDIPQWLADQGIEMRAYEIDGAQGLAPDWDDPKFLQAHHDFIMALGAQYDSDPRVAWIDIGSYGFWGEWHVWLNDSLAATQATKQAILEDYFAAFPTKQKVIAFDDDFATKYVTDHGGGIRNDCLGTEDSNNWYLESLNAIDPNLNDRVWKTAIITGEFCGSGYGAQQGTTTRFELNYQFIQQTHWSFIGSAGGAVVPQDEEHQKNLDKLHKKLGYRFVLKEVTHAASVSQGKVLDLAITVENKGVAPFYYNWPLMLYLIDKDGTATLEKELPVDLITWLPGEKIENVTVQIPAKLTTGDYDVKLAIEDPDTGKPGVMLANTHRDTEGRYLISRVKIN
ncbi:MAG: DUF4832 domain-containing protein [Candidatus Marinimicrobia bacterium]|nr:DUF4832 domain-containing protein [Candidatus Neomarinimicrobiota bacterium]MCF7830206.1 DUF4832 domain-containing protein [Candidatus Neomarinimicrobiota bacterium]MCF7880823.1 DUF4832 domain-containing protein [Candidatus Neomarinimicrobiota bacterium]